MDGTTAVSYQKPLDGDARTLSGSLLSLDRRVVVLELAFPANTGCCWLCSFVLAADRGHLETYHSLTDHPVRARPEAPVMV